MLCLLFQMYSGDYSFLFYRISVDVEYSCNILAHALVKKMHYQKPDDQTISLRWQGEEPRLFVSKGVRFYCESVGNYVSIMCSTGNADWQCTVQGEHRKLSAFQ